MTKVELCDECGRPLWEERCIYCRGYRDGVSDTRNRKVKKEYLKTPAPITPCETNNK